MPLFERDDGTFHMVENISADVEEVLKDFMRKQKVPIVEAMRRAIAIVNFLNGCPPNQLIIRTVANMWEAVRLYEELGARDSLLAFQLNTAAARAIQLYCSKVGSYTLAIEQAIMLLPPFMAEKLAIIDEKQHIHLVKPA
jgi:hypothetical protein